MTLIVTVDLCLDYINNINNVINRQYNNSNISKATYLSVINNLKDLIRDFNPSPVPIPIAIALSNLSVLETNVTITTSSNGGTSGITWATEYKKIISIITDINYLKSNYH